MSKVNHYYSFSPLKTIADKQKNILKSRGISIIETKTHPTVSYSGMVGTSEESVAQIAVAENSKQQILTPQIDKSAETDIYEEYQEDEVTEVSDVPKRSINYTEETYDNELQEQIEQINTGREVINNYNAHIQQQINIFNHNAQLLEQQKFQIHQAYHQIGLYQTKVSQQFIEIEDLEARIKEKKAELEEYEKRINYCKMITDTMNILTMNSAAVTPAYSTDFTVQQSLPVTEENVTQ